MRTELFIVIGALLLMDYCLPSNCLNATQSVAAKSESEAKSDSKNANAIANNTNYVVTNAHTKLVNGTELFNVLLRETERDKNSKESEISVNKTLSRKTTPTDPNLQVAGNIPKGVNKETNSNGNPQSTTVKPKEKNISVVAEGGIALEIPVNKNVVNNNTTSTDKAAIVIKPTEAHVDAVNQTISDKRNDTTASIKPQLNSTTTTLSPTTIKVTTTTTKKTTAPTTITTSSTTTPKPKKPTITFGLEDLPETELQKAAAAAAQSTSSKLPMPETAPVREFPNAEPSQEMSASFHSNRDYIVLVLTIMFTIPLAIGVLITAYRRFRDYWSTRHYRRMDFLVDGMYNE